jgi:glycosyltransferase involved in cell wall biosynthesis
MRVLIGSNRYFPDVAGGGNRVAFDAAQQLVAEGHEVALLSEGIPGKPENEKLQGIQVLRYTVSRLDLDFFSRHQRAAKRTLKKHLLRWQPDLLWGHMPLQMSAMMSSFPGARMTYTMHSPVSIETLESGSTFGFSLGQAIKSQVLLGIERRCCESSSIITVLSEFTRAEIKRLHGDTIAAKVRITPGWADVHRFHPAASRGAAKAELEWPADRPVLFCIRRFVPRMGLDRLLDAAAILRDKGLKFHVYLAGKGPLRSRLELQIAKLRLDEHVRLVGSVSEQQLALMYSAADAFVIPTRALECFGLVAVEAMSAGTPVLSTPVGALPEIINRIEPAWLAQDNSAEAIATLMTAYIGGELPKHSAEELRSFVEQHYTRDRALPNFVHIATGAGT